MGQKICLDSDIIIALLRNDEKTKELIASIDGNFITTVINTFEIWNGRKKDENIIFQVLEILENLTLDKESAKLATDIQRELKIKGKLAPLRDLLIGAICIKNNAELLTYNKNDFKAIEDYGLVLVK